MKQILIVCLLGIGLLLPSTTITAKEFPSKEISKKRIVDIWMEGDAAHITSDASTGTLVTCKIWDPGKHLVLQESISGYADDVDVSGLSSGYYSIQVFTTLTVYSENVYIN